MYAVLLSLLLATPGYTQDKPQLIPADFRDFSGGLVDNTDPINLQPNQSPAIQNVVIDDPLGSLKPRKGFSSVGNLPSGNIATNIFEYASPNGVRYLIATDNQNVYATTDFQTWTKIKDSISPGIVPSFASVRDKLWVATGSTWTFTWDSVSTTSLSGTAGTPNPPPPKCRYLEFWKEKVWCARWTTYPSGLQWSRLDDDGGNDIDPSTGSASWPATNIINVNQDDGTPIVGIKVYRDRLYVFKENGIYQIYFNNDFDNSVAKVSNVGAKFNTAIIELDNLLYFVGVDGIYAFDGEQALRISDAISNTFATFNQVDAISKFKQWDSLNDFSFGTVAQTSYTAVPGSVVLSSGGTSGPTNGNFETGSILPHIAYKGAPSSQVGLYANGTSGNFISGDWYGVLSCDTGQSGYHFLTIYNVAGTTRTEINIEDMTAVAAPGISTAIINTSAYAGESVYLNFRGYCGTEGAISLLIASFTATNEVRFHYIREFGFRAIDNITTRQYPSTGAYYSEAYNAVAVSSWTIFEAIYESNDGTIDFSYRTGHDTADISTTAWISIMPGGMISAPATDTYFQFLSSFTAPSSLSNTPNLEAVTINYLYGSGNTTQIYAAKWKNRIWVSASTGTSQTNNGVYVKSKYPSNAFVPYTMQIGPMTRYNNNFYAASSTSSEIYRMDFGTNDDGDPIDWFWTSRDELWGSPWHIKQLYEISSDFRKDAAPQAYVAYSSDMGVTFSSSAVNMNGSYRGTDRRYVGNNSAQAYRLRVGDSYLNETATILGLTGWAFPEKLRK